MDTAEGKTIEELREFLIPVATSVAMCRLAVFASLAALVYDWCKHYISLKIAQHLIITLDVMIVLCLGKEVRCSSLFVVPSLTLGS